MLSGSLAALMCDLTLISLPAQAQVTPDGTTPTNPGACGAVCTITGGTSRGVNLFHSFRDFNVGENQQVRFANPAGIENILNRVTGDTPSRILGTLGVNGPANLFLLNPNGILFGPNARLDVQGSFLASTGDRFLFPDGSEFSAVDPQAPPLLTVNITPGLQTGTAVGSLTQQGQLMAGQDLTLRGHTLTLNGSVRAGRDLTLQADHTLQIRDSGAQPFVAAAGRHLLAQGNQTVDIFALNHPDSGFFAGGDLRLRSLNPVGGDAHYSAGGSVRIETLTGQLGQLYSPADPVILALGDVALAAYEGQSLHIWAGGSVVIPGYIWMQGSDPVNSIAENVTLANGSVIPINGALEPTVDIRAGVDWAALGGLPGDVVVGPVNPPPVFVPGATRADIGVGTIFFADAAINPTTGTGTPLVGRVLLTNQYAPRANQEGSIVVVNTLDGLLTNRAIVNGDFLRGGEIDIHSRGDIGITGIVNADPAGFAGTILGDGGDITLRAAGNVVLAPGALINSTGIRGGTIVVEGGETVEMSGPPLVGAPSGILSASLGPAPGDRGGDIRVTAGTLRLSEGVLLSTNTTGAVSAGNIVINARDDVQVTGGSQLRTDTFGLGDAGAIAIAAGGDVLFDGTALVNGVVTSSAAASSVGLDTTNPAQPLVGIGNAGVITVNADNLFLQNGAALFSSTLSQGNAGDIRVRVNDQIVLENGSYIRGLVEVGGIGQAANIDLRGRSLTVLSGSQIGSALFRETNGVAGGRGTGGTIDITMTDSVVLDGISAAGGFSSGLLAVSERGAFGPAGAINVTTGDLLISNGAIIGTSIFNEGGPGGDITLIADNLVATGGGQILANTRSSQPGGTIDVRVADTLLLQGVDANFPNRVAQVIQDILNEGSSDRVDDRIGNEYSFSGIFATTGSSPINPDPNPPLNSGAAGTIRVQASNLLMADAALISASTSGNGDAGNVDVFAQNTLLLSGAEILSQTIRGAGAAGNVTVQPLDPTLPSTVTLIGTAPLTLPDGTIGGASSGLLATTEPDATGRGGNVSVTTGLLRILDGAVLSARTRSSAPGGDVEVTANRVRIDGGGQILTAAFDQGPAGNIRIQANGRVTITGRDPEHLTRFRAVEDAFREQFLAQGLSEAEANDRAFEAARFRIDPVNEVSGLQARSLEPIGTGSGDIHIRAGDLRITNDAELSVSTAGIGNAGAMVLRSTGPILLDDARLFSTVERGAIANGGRITIRGRSLTMRNGGQIQSLVRGSGEPGDLPAGQGNAGTIRVEVQDDIRLDGVGVSNFTGSGIPSLISSEIEDGAVGRGGDIRLTTRRGSLFLTNGSEINASLSGIGQGGGITLDIADDIVLAGEATVAGFTYFSDISSKLEAGGIGSSGRIAIDARSLILAPNGEISTSTSGLGPSGDIAIAVDDLLWLDDATIRALVEEGGVGQGGDVTVRGRSLLFTNGGQISASLFRDEPNNDRAGAIGRGGTIRLVADTITLTGQDPDQFPSGLLVNTETGANGPAGSIRVRTHQLNVLDNALITAATNNARDAGDIVLNVGDRMTVGTGGRVLVDGNNAGNPGNLVINAGTLNLLDGGKLQGETESGLNANITLRVGGNLLMRGRRSAPDPNDLNTCQTCSEISTEARNDGSGGNITIDADFVLGVFGENSDISANAFRGNGGSVDITAQDVRGLEFRPNRTVDNDITASSEFGLDGTVEIETLGIDPSRGLAELPATFADASTRIARTCSPQQDSGDRAEFVITGRGGLPPTPTDLRSSDALVTDWAQLDEAEPATVSGQTTASGAIAPTPVSATAPIIEAQAWTTDVEGRVVLVAHEASTDTHLTPPACALVSHAAQ